MSSPQEDASAEAAAKTRQLSERAYGIALPTLSAEYGLLNKALSEGGEPGYLKDAYKGARGAAVEGMAESQIGALKGRGAQEKGALGAGAVGFVSPQGLGSEMAKALYGTRVQEASGQISQMDKLLGASLGQSQVTGSGALNATSNELANIGMMQPYNSTYAGILGALNVGGAVYGAWPKGAGPYASAIGPGGYASQPNWQGFGPGVGNT